MASGVVHDADVMDIDEAVHILVLKFRVHACAQMLPFQGCLTLKTYIATWSKAYSVNMQWGFLPGTGDMENTAKPAAITTSLAL
jgi:hypothetical protein